MLHYLPICFILAILGTLLVNPALYYSPIYIRKKNKQALKEKEENNKAGIYFGEKTNYTVFFPGNHSLTGLIVGQIVSFVLLFFATSLLYFVGPVVLKPSTVLAYLWFPGIVHIFRYLGYNNSFIDSSFSSEVEEIIVKASLVLGILFFAIPIAIGCHKGIYNYLYPYTDITFMEEDYQEYPSVDETTLLKEANLAAGSSLKDPVYRNGNWIYPVVNNSSHVESSGYLVVDATTRNISFVPKDIVYSPWVNSRNDVLLLARRLLPSKVFWGFTTFRIDPETEDIYFCIFYGDYACFRAGREVEGAILINATTGAYERYPMDEIPAWVTGISF